MGWVRYIEMFSFTLNTKIYRPLQEVFKFVATPENDFEWQYGTLTSTQVSGGAIGVGTLFRTKGHLIRRLVEGVYEITEYETNQKYGFKSLSGPMRLHTLYTFEISYGSTRINMFFQVSPEDFFKANDASVEKSVKKQCRENLALLKSILETRHIVR